MSQNSRGTKDLVYVGRNDDIQTLLTCFYNNKISHVPVIENKQIVGIVSKTDMTDFFHRAIDGDETLSFSDFVKTKQVKEVMIQPVIEAQIDEPTLSLLEKIISHQISSVVIKDGSKIAGIVTEKDMLLYLTKHFEGNQSLTSKVVSHIIQWMEKNGVFHVSRALADVGI